MRDLFPRSNASIRDLDQAVALLGGATVIGFSPNRTADARYRAWFDRARARQEHRALAMVRFRATIAELELRVQAFEIGSQVSS